jgi:hypothetical protein
MTRNRILSGLAVLVLAIGLAGGQPPATVTNPGAPPPAKPDAKAGAKPPSQTSLEDAIATAMRSNPDIRVAEAEVQMAQAKLNQVRVQTAQKVAAAHANLATARQAAGYIAEQLQLLQRVQAQGGVPRSEVLQLQSTLARFQSDAAKYEAEYNSALGTMPGQPPANAATAWEKATLFSLEADGPIRIWNVKPGTRWSDLTFELIAQQPKPPAGSVSDKLREALDKPVKLGDQTNTNLATMLGSLLKAAGLEIRLRLPPAEDPTTTEAILRLDVPGGEYPLGTWFQLVTDEYALKATALPRFPRTPEVTRFEIYVREYGLLVADPKSTAPPGAITVQDFWRQVKAEKAKEKGEPKK